MKKYTGLIKVYTLPAKVTIFFIFAPMISNSKRRAWILSPCPLGIECCSRSRTSSSKTWAASCPPAHCLCPLPFPPPFHYSRIFQIMPNNYEYFFASNYEKYDSICKSKYNQWKLDHALESKLFFKLLLFVKSWTLVCLI